MLFYDTGFIFEIVRLVLIVGIVVLCVCLERRKKSRRNRDKNGSQDNNAHTENPGAEAEKPQVGNRQANDSFSDSVKPRNGGSGRNDGSGEKSGHDKAIRVVATVVASLCTLVVFTITAFAFFQTRTALYYATQKIDRYVSAGRAKAYFAISVVCAVICAASVVITFLRWRNIYGSQIYYIGFMFVIPLAFMTYMFIIFYASYELKGVMVFEILFTLCAIAYAVLSFVLPPQKERKKI